MGRCVALLAVVAAATMWPASAWAATGQLQNGVMIYTATAGESNNVVFTTNTFGSPTFEVRDAPSVSITPTPPCFNGGSNNIMECPQDGGGTGQVVLFQASLGDGNDTISLQADLPTSIGAGGGADVMSGGPAADFLRGGQGDDTITGGAANDQLVGDDPNVSGGGNDSLDGGTGDDSEDGQDGNDVVRGGQGNDTLQGGGGNDTFPAESGADGTDDVHGGDGVDTAAYAARTDPLQLSLDDQPNDGLVGAATDNLHTDVENLVGGSAADVLTGDAAANSLDGGPGDDRESGGDGGDSLQGGDGNDTESGDAGADSLAGGPGADSLSGGADADSLDGGADDDTLDGGAGADVIGGGDGVDLADYSSRVSGVVVTLDGQPGDGEPGEGDNVETDVENLRGGSGGDVLSGDAAANALDGGDGNDSEVGGAGADSLVGGNGADSLDGGDGNDSLDDGPGEDYSDGGAGSDTLSGGDSGDVLRTRGSAEPDAVACGPGPDFVVAKPTDTVASDCDRVDRGVRQRPKRRDSAVVTPGAGTLQMSPAGIVRRVPLLDKVVLPLRSVVDTLAGSARVTTTASARRTQTLLLRDGAFGITQTGGKLPVTQLALQGGDFSVCPPPAPRLRASTAAAKTVRRLWATGKGKFRTKGRYAAATIRGTQWETVDRCDGTLVRVARGAVSVRDLVTRKTVVVRAGRSYLAKAR